MNRDIVASRTLRFRKISSGEVGEVTVQISTPYLLKPDMVDFPVSERTAGCSVRVLGIGTDYYNQEVYGADTLQALELAVDVEGIFKRISKEYDLFFLDGDPYFE